MLPAHAPAHIALAEGEQGYCLDVFVPAECEAISKGPVEEPCLVQVSGEGGLLMNRRRQGHAELPPQHVNVTVVAADFPGAISYQPAANPRTEDHHSLHDSGGWVKTGLYTQISQRRRRTTALLFRAAYRHPDLHGCLACRW